MQSGAHPKRALASAPSVTGLHHKIKKTNATGIICVHRRSSAIFPHQLGQLVLRTKTLAQASRVNGGNMKLEILHKDWQGKCAYCDVPTKLQAMLKEQRRAATRDHFIPLSAGGGKGKNNLVLACKPCNERKDDFDPRIFVDIWHRLDRKALHAHVQHLEQTHLPITITGRIRAMLNPRRKKKPQPH